MEDTTSLAISDIINSLGGSKSVAKSCGVQTAATRAWVWNGAFPKRHYDKLLDLAASKGVSLSPGALEAAHG